jgi:hypothetical protein
MADWLLISHDDPSIKKHKKIKIIWDVIVFTTKIWKKLPSSLMVFFFVLHIRNVVGWFHCSGWANQNPKHQF